MERIFNEDDFYYVLVLECKKVNEKTLVRPFIFQLSLLDRYANKNLAFDKVNICTEYILQWIFSEWI